MRPDFARDYPSDPALQALVEDFARGNYRAVRDGAAALLADSTTDETVRAAANELVARTGADRTMVILFAVATAALATIWIYWIAKGHG